MAKERYINADELITKIRNLYINVPMTSSYDPVAQAIASQLSNAISSALINFQVQLVRAIEESATLDGPCFLCKQPRKDCEDLPVDSYGGRNAA